MPPPLQTYEDELRDRTALHMQVADLTQSQDFRRVYGIPDDIDDADAAWPGASLESFLHSLVRALTLFR